MEQIESGRSLIRNFAFLLFKFKWQIVIVVAGVLSAALVYTLQAEPVYEASAQILVKTIRDDIYISASGKLMMSPKREQEINSEIEVLRGRSLAEQLVQNAGAEWMYPDLAEMTVGDEEPGLSKAEVTRLRMEEAVVSFQNSLNVEWVEESNIIGLRFRHPDREKVAVILNRFAAAYLDRYLQVHKNPQSFKFFGQQADILKEKLKESEDRLRLFKTEHQLTDIREEKDILLRQMSAMRAQLNEAETEEVALQSRDRLLRQQLAQTPQNIQQQEEVEHVPGVVADLESRLVELEIQEKELLVKYNPNSRKVRNVQEEIAVIQQKLAEFKVKRYGTSRYGVNLTYQALHEALLKNETDLSSLKARKASLQEQLEAYRERLEGFNQLELEVQRLENEIQLNRNNYNLYQTKFEESRISDAMDSEKITNVSLIEPARAPLYPVSPRKRLNVMVGAVLGVLAAVGIAVLRQYMDDSLERPEDVERSMELPVIGSVPEFGRRHP